MKTKTNESEVQGTYSVSFAAMKFRLNILVEYGDRAQFVVLQDMYDRNWPTDAYDGRMVETKTTTCYLASIVVFYSNGSLSEIKTMLH